MQGFYFVAWNAWAGLIFRGLFSVLITVCVMTVAEPTPTQTSLALVVSLDQPGQPGQLNQSDKIRSICQDITAHASELGADPRGLSAVEFAYRELVENILRHAYRPNPQQRRIWIEMWRDRETLFLRVADESGNFFDAHDPNEERNRFRFKESDGPDAIDQIQNLRATHKHDPTRPDGDGGRGILIVQGLQAVQSLVYQPHCLEGRTVGTAVTVGFRLSFSETKTCPGVLTPSLPVAGS